MTDPDQAGDWSAGAGASWKPGMLVPVFLAVASILVALGLLVLRDAPIDDLAILTGPEGGAYDRIGRRIEAILENGPRLASRIEVESTAGSNDNAGRIRSGAGPLLALVQADSPVPPNTRLIMPLYQERLYFLAKLDDSVSATDVLTIDWLANLPTGEPRSIFLGEERSGTRQIAGRVLSFFGVDVEQGAQSKAPRVDTEQNAENPLVRASEIATRREAIAALEAALRGESSELDGLFLLDTYPSQQVETLVEQGAALLSLGDPAAEYNEVATLALRHPVYRPFVLPKRSYGDAAPVQTISVSALLVASADLPDWIAREVPRRLFEERAKLTQPLEGVDEDPVPSMNALRERYDPAAHMIPFHEGAEEYYRRNEPSYVGQNAELLSFMLGIAGVLFSTGVFAWQRFSLKKKNRIDRYYNIVGGISNRMRSDDRDTLLKLRDELDAVREMAFDDLVNEMVEADESFLIFQNFMQGQQRSIEAKLDRIEAGRS